MLKRRLLAGAGNYALSGAVALLLASLAAATRPCGPIRLAGSEMSTSRGKTLANNFGSCNALSKFNACAANNNPCNTCGPTSAGQQYAFAGGQGRQVDPGVAGAGNCNNIYNGTCNLANGILFCNTSAPGGGDTTNPCTAPPGVPPQEPQ